ncbi:PAS domain-containing hybrid sensor histidine kinase/response regulator [uncultured Sulfitobacter sp.]|uniref:PAS domain-containing hybrid sensor histidine kinase/response regulator n=1 Tax=uncultured Sulfitobacter sp. TaxID=191468 RepID=UPI002601BA80|nr:PAS domain-containing hybrid sensor histidine kinase/response regulator [uncultured Sulfitobacter sp.]
MKKLKWAMPTIIAALLVQVQTLLGFALPAPFFILMTCVIIAGSLGGLRAGLVGGSVASAVFVRAYFVQFGPVTLTGDIPQVVTGVLLFHVIGGTLGHLKDQRDASIEAFREIEKKLKLLLLDKTIETEKQISKVAESEAQLRTAVRIAGIGHFSFGAQSDNCEYCSDQHAAHFGLTADEFCLRASGPNAQLSLIHPSDRAVFQQAIERLDAGEAQNFEYRALWPNGDVRYIHQIEEPIFDANGKMIESVGTSIDLTELRLAEAAVRQSQRIEAIGTLTGGVAHDFNNLLAIILGNLELCLEVNDEAERDELVGYAIEATLRGADLTKNLLSFSRRAYLEPKRLNLNALVENTMTWSSRVLPATIDLKVALMTELWDVELDPTSAENAIINILLNGRDAMPSGGTMKIETSNIAVHEDEPLIGAESFEPGRYVRMTISDTGCGISPEKIEKVYEPFFTDKPLGFGSGMGLSMVQGFIKQSNGSIQIESEIGIGTTFNLIFKATDQQDIQTECAKQDTDQQSRGKGAVLLAEDEEEVMRVLKRTLEGAGYDVTTAKSGDEALAIFSSPKRFDLLLTDVVMPGNLLGPALAEAIRVIDPDMPCIFLSGYASDAIAQDTKMRTSDIHLMKPVNRSDLLHTVFDVLQTTTAGS